eukprot:scaffold91043_cov19-Prasinocladus_malaysianus.AAC.1
MAVAKARGPVVEERCENERPSDMGGPTLRQSERLPATPCVLSPRDRSYPPHLAELAGSGAMYLDSMTKYSLSKIR